MNTQNTPVVEQEVKLHQEKLVLVNDNLHDKRYTDPFEDEGSYADDDIED